MKTILSYHLLSLSLTLEHMALLGEQKVMLSTLQCQTMAISWDSSGDPGQILTPSVFIPSKLTLRVGGFQQMIKSESSAVYVKILLQNVMPRRIKCLPAIK
jgi:hypothetical protein